MADTQTPNLLLANQTEGGNNNTWGTIADANYEEIDDKFGDVTSISTTGGTTVLTTAQEIVNAITVSGTLVNNAIVEFSGRGGSWVVKNSTTGSYTVTARAAGQSGMTIDQGATTVVYFNGTDIDAAVESAAAVAEQTVASATTCDVLGAASEFIAVSGTTTVTSFGTGTNRKRFVRAAGAFKITHNATSLICPGAQDIVTAAGDTFIILADASSNARIVQYQRAANPPPTIPIGVSFDYWGSTAPAFYLFVYGQNVSRTTYAALFAVLSTSYGSGDGATTFGLPDLRGRAILGKDDMGGSSANRLTNQTGGIDGDTLGATGGTETHALTAAQGPAHTHTGTTDSDGAHTHTTTLRHTAGAGGSSFNSYHTDAINGSNAPITSSDGAHTHTFTTASAGSGDAHNNVQPSIVANKILFVGV